MARVPTPRGCVKIEKRLGYGEAQPCHRVLESVTTYTCENGTYTITTTWPVEWIINGGGTCSDPDIVSTAEEGFDYGLVLSAETEETDVVPDGDALSQAAGHVLYPLDGDGDPIWDTEAAGIKDGKLQIFGACETVNDFLAEAWKSVILALATHRTAQLRFSLLLPMACRVIIQRGFKLPDPPEPDPPSEWEWGDEEPIELTPSAPEYTANVTPGEVDVHHGLRLVRYEYIPYA